MSQDCLPSTHTSESPRSSLCFWPIGYRSEVPMTPSLGLINLLEQLTGLRNICFHLPYIGNYKVAYYRGYYEGYRWAYVCLVKAMVFLVVMYRCGSWTIKKAEAKELMLSNFGAGEDPESPLDSKQIKPLNPKGNQPWIFIERTDWCWRCSSNTLATWCKEPTHWKRPSCWERLRARGEGDNKGWDGWMASPTQRTWVWVNSGS